MFNKKSIGLSKLFLISVIAFTSLDLAADDSNQNAIPSIDNDNDGHIDWFEIDVITNGQVHPDWDYGATGFIGLYDYSDSIAEEINAYGPRDYPPKSISYCETNQSRQFPEFVAASRDLMQAENIDAQEMSSHICQHQKITHVIDRENEGNSEHDYLKATFRAVSGDENFEFHGSHESFMEYRLKEYTQNRLKIARSSSLNLSGISELYLDIEIRANSPFPFGNMFMGFNDLRIGISKLGWKNEISFWSFIPVDERCDSYNYRDLDKPFDPSICDFNMIRVPVKSLSRAGIPSVNDLSFLEDLNTISLDFNRGIQQQCQWWWGCELYSISYDIKSVKIVGGDRFPNNPNEYMDSDNDGIGSNSDPDNDNDGIPNELDSFEFNPQAKADLDGDGIANEADIDSDGDGIPRTSFGINSSHPDGAWFGLDISQDNYGVFFDAATEAGCDVYDLACYGPDLAYSLKVDSLNPLVLVGSNGGVLTWWGGNEFGQDEDDDNDGYLDNLVQPFESGSHRDLFPQDPLAWSDVDLDCVPDNIDNNLNSLSDIDCDGLDDSVDTDDDNDTIPDNLVVPIIEKGLLDNLWQADTNIIDISGSQLCVIEDAGSNPSANCNQLRVSYQQDNEDGESGLMQLDFTQQSAETLWNNIQGIEFKTFSDINIQSMDRGSNLLPAGYFEVELQLTGVTGDEEIGFTLLTSNQEISEKLPKNLKTYWPQVYSGNWTSLKIPLYEFFNHLEYFQYSQLLPYLGRINGLRVHAAPEQNAYSIKIKNMQFVIQDQYISTSQNIWDYNPSLSSIDFDDDGATGSYDEHPFIANIDANENGITDGLESDSLVLRNNIATSIYEFTATNKCNFTPRVALNDKIIVRVDASESLMKPSVTILGEEVEISGQHNEWVGEFELTQAPVREENAVVAAKVIDFIKAETFIPEVEAASIFTSADGLGLSSEQMINLVTAMEVEFGLDLPDPLTEPGKINTVQQVVNSIQSTELEIPVTVSFQNLNGELGYAELAEEKKLKFCEQNCQCFPTDISGTWENRKKAGSMGVGKSKGSLASWSISDFDLETRHCVFDDTYTFGVEDPESDDTGSFSQFMDNLTWLETWMSPDGNESCGAPVAPWDGSGTDHTYIWDPENKELTVKGSGAHIGLPRIQNESSADTDGPSGKIVYNVATASTCILILDIKGAENWWHFELEKIKDSNGEPMTPEKCAASSGGSGGSSADITTDTDGDGVPDIYDIFPDDSSRTIDTDMDGYANEYDDDDDGDGYPDVDDCAPLDAFVSVCEGDGSSNTDNGIDLTNATQVPVVISEQFGNAEIIPPTDDSPSIYRVPTAAEDWAGFTMVPTVAEGEVSDALPISFGKGGQVKFNASVIGSPSASVRFRFEKNPATDTDPSPTVPTYTTLPKYIGGEDVVEYTVDIPPMGSRVFNSMIFYIDNKGVSISITDIVVSETEAGEGSEVGPIAFVYQFGGAVISQDIPDAYNLPTGNPGGGFSIEKGESSTSTPGANTDANPLYFGNGGYISFVGSVPDGGSVGVKFEVQADSHPNHLPNYETDLVTVSGSLPLNYSVSIPEQYDNGYKMVILWLQTPDKDVVLSEIMIGVTAKGDAKAATVAPADFSTGPFEGAAYDEETSTFSFPTSAKSYAGFANNNTELYPMTFDNGGCVTFNASAETDVRIRYKVERQPYPGNMPEMYTDWVTISGTEQEYTVDVPASASAGNTYSSFLLFIDPDYKDLPVGVNTVIATNTGPCGVGVTAKGDPKPAIVAAAEFEAFEGASYDEDTNTFIFPSTAKSYAGFGNTNTDLVPLKFDNGGCVTFNASAETDLEVRFKFEKQAYPGNIPEMFTDWVTISGTEQEYTVDVPASASAGNTYSSFLLFIDPDYKDLPVGVNTVIATNTGPCGVGLYANNAIEPSQGADGARGLAYSSYTSSDSHQALNGSTTTYLDYSLAKQLPNQLGQVQIPSQFEQIGYRAFKGLDVTSVDIPDSVAKIHSMAFQNNSRLTEINFGNSITHIGAYSFEKTAIKHVTLPDTVTQIGPYAFANSDVEQIYLGNSIEYIGDFAFAGAKISTLIIPSTVKSIGDNAFDYLDGNVYVISPADQVISKFNFPSTAKFFSCLGVDVYGNPGACQESYKLIGNNIFDGPAALRNFQNGHITIPNTYHSIGERAFEEFQGILNSVTIPETVTHIGDYAFKDLGLTSILLPNSVVSIGNGAFAGNQLSNISLPNNLMHVGYAAFAGNNLGYVVLPANLSEVGAGAFINSNLSTVIFPEGLAKIEQNAFANNAITTVNLPSSLHYIGDGAFENNQISSAVFNANGSMGKNSFANNPLTTITLAEDVTSIGGLDSMPPWLSMDYIGEELIIQTADDEIIIVDNDEYNKNGGSIDGIIIGYKQIHSKGEIYTDREVTASSYYYGGIDVIITGTIDPNVAGTQIITYTATDPLGNSASIRGEVVVVDNILPNVSLNGSAVVIVESNAYFEDPGATAFDKVDDKFIDIYTAIELCGSFEDNECKDSQTVTTIDTNSPGTYIATYSAIDSTGNVGIATRQIIVLQGFNDEVVVWDGNFGAAWDKGISAFDEALDWGAVNTSGDAPSIDWEIVNDPERGDVIQVAHVDNDQGAGIFIESSTANNLLGAKDGGIVQFDIKIISGDPNITIKAGCAYPCGGGPRDLGVQKVGEWTTVRYSVLNMLPGGNDGSTGLDLDRVTTGLEIWATGQRATVFQIDNISWKCVESCEGQEFVPTFTPWEKVDITNGYDAPTSYDGYDLVWSDEFNGTEVDTTKWGFALGNGSPEGNVGWGNSELQHYRPENATVADGMLSIEAQYHSPLLPEVNGNWIPYGARYTSARLETQGKFSFQYGRVDIRTVVAEGKGLWSSGWMLGDNNSTIGWPRAGEIDIVDTIGGPGQEDMIVNNMYWNPVGPSQSEYGKANINDSGFGEVLASEISDIDGETFSNTFHVFSIIWTEDRVDFYVDGILTTPVTLTGTLKETFTQSPFSLILGVAVGGNWAGAPVFEDTDTPTQFPRGMMVDYVRVYQPSTNTPLYQGISNGVTESDIGSNSYVNQFTTDNNQQDTSTDAIQFDWQANETRGVNYSISSNSVDTDGDGENNNIDNDDDGDNVPDYRDDFPLDPNEWLDTDNDGIGNNSDTDDDNDAVFDSIDAFPLNANEWLDTDADGIGNNADNDDDGDRITDINDLFSLSNRDWLDIDLDGIGNNSDIDSDGDGVVNSLDAFPLNSSEWVDTDGAGVGDNADNDDDNDGVLDPDDAFPKDPNQWLFPDTDNDGYRDNNDAFPSDPSEWLDTDADGIGNNADNDDDGDGIDDALDSAPLDATIPGGDDKQIISVMGNPVGVFGKSTLLDIGYSTSNNDNTTTGIGFRVHFDSNLMNVSDVVHVAEKDLIVDATGPLYDDENYDNDDATDQYYTVGWGAIGGDWPNDELPLKVLSLRVEVTQNAGQLDVASTPIKFSYTALASGYNFIAENYNLELVSSTWDFDGSGHADALTDGLIMLRYAFGLRGENLVNGVMDPSSVMTASEVEEKIQSSLDMMDIDKDGTVNALTDGLLLLRYLFDLTGEGLVRDVVSATAERASLHEITQHIERHMPQAIIE